jgi:hypothetical protein
MKGKKMSKYIFKYDDEGEDAVEGFPLRKQFTHEVTIAEGETWEVPLRSFTDFLSSVYGYDISESVTVNTLMPSEHFNFTLRDDDVSKRVRKAIGEFDDEDTPNNP